MNFEQPAIGAGLANPFTFGPRLGCKLVWNIAWTLAC
jgi:hypothetical protein